MKWNVELKFGYNEVFFTFDNFEDAGMFVETALTSFNQKLSENNKKLEAKIQLNIDDTEEKSDNS